MAEEHVLSPLDQALVEIREPVEGEVPEASVDLLASEQRR